MYESCLPPRSYPMINLLLRRFGRIMKCGFIIIGILLFNLTLLTAGWVDTPPALPSPSGRVVNVSTKTQLEDAIASLTSDTTVMIAPGTYQLTSPLYIKGPLTNVTVRGATSYRDDVVLAGAGRDNSSVSYGIWVGGDVRQLTIANLTIRDVYYHPIIMNAGPTAPRLYNIHLINGGEQLLKTNPNDDNISGIDNGVIEYSVFEYSPLSRDWYANAIQVLGGKNWIIRNNLIRNIRAPQGEQAGPAVLAWFAAGGTIVEGNTFINCQREISMGLIDRTPNDHAGGIVRNNFIYRDSSVQLGDVAIAVFDSPNTKVLNNSILISGTYGYAIEYRFAGTTGALIANNLADAQIRSRENATATVQNNYLSASTALFMNAPNGDMHLSSSATAAIDKATTYSDITTDWDGDPRTVGLGPDLGADEYMAGSRPLPPTNVRIND
jgi:hypothetical protein